MSATAAHFNSAAQAEAMERLKKPEDQKGKLAIEELNRILREIAALDKQLHAKRTEALEICVALMNAMEQKAKS